MISLKSVMTSYFKAALLVVVIVLSGFRASAELAWYPLPEEGFFFYKKYPEVQRLLWAFDYGHGLLYERLLLTGATNFPLLEEKTFNQVIDILKHPPLTKPNEDDISPHFCERFRWTCDIFEWNHMLHQFTYDLTARYGADIPEKQLAVVMNKYTSLKNMNVPVGCKSMRYMEGYDFSLQFRIFFPKFNGLIWAYHDLQLRLYDALMIRDETQQRKAVEQSVAYFWKLVEKLPSSGPQEMPMARQTTPEFFRKYTFIAARFDNMHALHDIISDILVADGIDKDQAGLTAVLDLLDPKKMVVDCSKSGHGPSAGGLAPAKK